VVAAGKWVGVPGAPARCQTPGSRASCRLRQEEGGSWARGDAGSSARRAEHRGPFSRAAAEGSVRSGSGPREPAAGLAASQGGVLLPSAARKQKRCRTMLWGLLAVHWQLPAVWRAARCRWCLALCRSLLGPQPAWAAGVGAAGAGAAGGPCRMAIREDPAFLPQVRCGERRLH